MPPAPGFGQQIQVTLESREVLAIVTGNDVLLHSLRPPPVIFTARSDVLAVVHLHPPTRRRPQRQRAAPAPARAIGQLPRLDLLPLPSGFALMGRPAANTAAYH